MHVAVQRTWSRPADTSVAAEDRTQPLRVKGGPSTRGQEARVLVETGRILELRMGRPLVVELDRFDPVTSRTLFLTTGTVQKIEGAPRGLVIYTRRSEYRVVPAVPEELPELLRLAGVVG